MIKLQILMICLGTYFKLRNVGTSGYGYKDQTHYLEGGESVFGFWLDGDDEQKPVIVGVFYRHKKGDDQSPPLSGGDPKTITLNEPESELTGGIGTNVGTGDKNSREELQSSYW